MLLLLSKLGASAQMPAGIAYYDVDRLYDTIPSLFYDDRAYTPEGTYGWDTERYRRKIRQVAETVDSMALPVVALYGVGDRAGGARHSRPLRRGLRLPAPHAVVAQRFGFCIAVLGRQAIYPFGRERLRLSVRRRHTGRAAAAAGSGAGIRRRRSISPPSVPRPTSNAG